MTAERPLYERDPDAWRAHLAEGNAKQARKRVSGDLLMRDGGGNILLVDPVYKPGWDLPGGMAEANESPLTATLREISEELGFTASAGRMLCVDWVPPHGPWDDLLAFIFDGGTLNKAQISSLRLADGELRAFEFCDEREARGRLRPRAWRRAAAALEALVTGNVLYLQDGHPVS